MKQAGPDRSVELSIVIPAFNEAENLRPLSAEIASALEPLGRAYEVVLVDDASSDETADVAARLSREDRRVRLVRHRTNRGQSTALITGFEAARGEVIVTLDADLQNDPADIPRLLAGLADADVVCGIRQKREDSWLRRVSSRLANRVRNRVTRESITDVGCSLRVFRALYVRGLPAFDGMHRFLPTLLRLNGARVTEVPVGHRPRRFGKSKYGVHNRLWRGLYDLFGVRWLQARWIRRAELDERRDRSPLG